MSSQAPSMKADQERVSQLLTDTVTLLCRNGLQYKTDMKVQGLLGITLDGGEEMFLVHIDKKFGEMIGAELVSLHANEETSTTGAPGAGSTASALDDDEDHEDGTDSDASATSVSTSSISRKRHRGPRRKRRASASSSLTTNSLVGSPSAEKKLATDNTVVVKPDPDAVLEEDDDLVMLDTPDSKHGLHDKDSMRESYGVTYLGGEPPRDPDIAEEESYVAELARQLRPTNHHQNSTATTSKQDQTAGCSTWDDPLAALTGVHNNATHLNSTGGEDPLLDPQAMSTHEPMFYSGPAGYVANPDFKRGKLPYSFVCPEPRCGKRFNYKHNLLRHQTIKHGRVPKQSFNSWLNQYEAAIDQAAQLPTENSAQGGGSMGSLPPASDQGDFLHQLDSDGTTIASGEAKTGGQPGPRDTVKKAQSSSVLGVFTRLTQGSNAGDNKLNSSNNVSEKAELGLQEDATMADRPGVDLDSNLCLEDSSELNARSEIVGELSDTVITSETGESSVPATTAGYDVSESSGDVVLTQSDLKQAETSTEDSTSHNIGDFAVGEEDEESPFPTLAASIDNISSSTQPPSSSGDSSKWETSPHTQGTSSDHHLSALDSLSKTTTDFFTREQSSTSAARITDNDRFSKPSPVVARDRRFPPRSRTIAPRPPPSMLFSRRVPPPSENIFQCDMCDKCYNLKHNLQRHQVHKHGRQPRSSFSMFSDQYPM